MALFVDTCGWIGFANFSDEKHERTVHLMKDREDLVTSTFVVDEVISFILNHRNVKLGPKSRRDLALRLLGMFQRSGKVQVLPVSPQAFSTAKNAFETFGYGMSLTDWTEVCTMLENGISDILTFDAAFTRLRSRPEYRFLRVIR